MTKTSKIALNITAIALLNIVFYICNFYPGILFGSFYSVGFLVIKVILWALYALTLIITFSSNETFFSTNILKSVGKNGFLKNFLILITLQLIFDFLLLLADNFSFGISYIYEDILLILHWLAVYTLIADRTATIWKNKKHLLAMIAVIAFALGGSIVWDIYQMYGYDALNTKYLETSPHLVQAVANVEFLHMVKIWILDFVVGCALIVMHTLGSDEDSENKIESNGGWRKLLVRMFISFDVAIVIMAVMMGFFPQNILVCSSGEGSSHINHQANGIFNSSESIYNVRYGMKSENSTTVYQIKKVSLQKGNIHPVYFELNAFEPDFIQGENMTVLPSCFKYNINDSNVYLYGNFAICFYENQVPRIVKVDELKNCENNDIITKICEQLIIDGNVFAFEYGCEYLLKYDENFIRPYITRYADGDFNDSEIEWLEASYYRSEYIVNLAKEFVK